MRLEPSVGCLLGSAGLLLSELTWLRHAHPSHGDEKFFCRDRSINLVIRQNWHEFDTAR